MDVLFSTIVFLASDVLLISVVVALIVAALTYGLADYGHRDSLRFWIARYLATHAEADAKAARLSRIDDEMRQRLHASIDDLLDDCLDGFEDDDDEDEDEDAEQSN